MKTEIVARGLVVFPLMIIVLFCSFVSEQIGMRPFFAETLAFYALILTIMIVVSLTLGSVLLLLVFQIFSPSASLNEAFEFFDTIADLLSGRRSEKTESLLLYATVLLVGGAKEPSPTH